MPEDLTLEAPEGLECESPDGENTPLANIIGARKLSPKQHLDLMRGFSVAVTRVVSAPPCDVDAQVIQGLMAVTSSLGRTDS